MNHTEWELGGKRLVLLPQKALLWPEHEALIIADFHLGKASHFRKSGIPVPFSVFYKNVHLFIQLLQWHHPKQVIFLGDLFHSDHNKEWQYFADVLEQFPRVEFILVKGNHDVLDEGLFVKAGLRVVDEWELDPFLLTHIPINDSVEGQYNLCGHVHPGVVLRGKARQGVKLPCFYFDGYHLLLPAFGEFTGLYRMKPERHHQVFVVVENKVIQVN